MAGPENPSLGIDFGTIAVDPFGNPTGAFTKTVWAANGTGTTYRLTVDDSHPVTREDTFPLGVVLYGPSGEAPSTSHEPHIVLEPEERIAIDLALEFTQLVEGTYSFTVRFNAEEVVQVPNFALNFDGENDLLQIPDNPNWDVGKMTVEAWVFLLPDSEGKSGTASLFENHDPGGYYVGLSDDGENALLRRRVPCPWPDTPRSLSG